MLIAASRLGLARIHKIRSVLTGEDGEPAVAHACTAQALVRLVDERPRQELSVSPCQATMAFNSSTLWSKWTANCVPPLAKLSRRAVRLELGLLDHVGHPSCWNQERATACAGRCEEEGGIHANASAQTRRSLSHAMYHESRYSLLQLSMEVSIACLRLSLQWSLTALGCVVFPTSHTSSARLASAHEAWDSRASAAWQDQISRFNAGLISSAQNR